MDKTSEELRSDFQSYFDSTVTQWQIRLTPGIKRNVQIFIWFMRDEMRMGYNTSHDQFDYNKTGKFLRRFNTQKSPFRNQRHFQKQQSQGN